MTRDTFSCGQLISIKNQNYASTEQTAERARARHVLIQSRNFDTGGSQKYTMRYFGINLQWEELKKKKTGESMAVH